MANKTTKPEETAVAESVEHYSGDVVNNGADDENQYLITFNKPYKFDDKTYTEIDLSGLDNLKAADMIAANKVLDRSGSFSFLPEMSLQYATIIASKATKLPIEFFNGLHPREAVKVKNKVVAFFFGQD